MILKSVFDWQGEPSIFAVALTRTAEAREHATRIRKVQQDKGNDYATIPGLSRAGDESARVFKTTREKMLAPARGIYSAPVEGAAQGRAASDRRDSLKRGASI